MRIAQQQLLDLYDQWQEPQRASAFWAPLLEARLLGAMDAAALWEISAYALRWPGASQAVTELALQACEKAAELEPTAERLSQLSLAHLRQADPREAILLAAQADQLRDRDSAGRDWAIMAIAHAALAEWEEVEAAVDLMEEALRASGAGTGDPRDPLLEEARVSREKR